jgi:phosphopantothenoylcysteine synthetase/decarboxylase
MEATVEVKPNDLAGRALLVTSGPTRGPIDAVRYIGNKSTGRLGCEIALQALERGATVRFIYGKDSLVPRVPTAGAARFGAREVETVEDLARAVREELAPGRFAAVLHAMAVLDFAPAEYLPIKTKSDREEWTIRLVRTPKVIATMKDLDPGIFLVGVKLEVGRTPAELAEIAREAIRRSRADLFVANDLTTVEGGEHTAYLVAPDGSVEGPFVGKARIAAGLLDRVARELAAAAPAHAGRR